WLRLRVGAWLAVPRTTSSRSDTTSDPTPDARWAAVLGWEMAGPGSGLSEEPAAGVEPATLDCRVVPDCPPGPVCMSSQAVCAARQPRIIWWQERAIVAH